jgi:hypothetical protein
LSQMPAERSVTWFTEPDGSSRLATPPQRRQYVNALSAQSQHRYREGQRKRQ